MALPPGLFGELFVATMLSRRRFSQLRRLTAVLVSLLLAGCGEEDTRQKAAYQEAVAAVAREQQTLKNVRSEQQRVFGEYLVNDFEGRIWAGSFSFSGALRLPWSTDAYERDPPLYVYFRDKLPLGWFGQLDRLLSEKPEALPWYGRTEGELYRRRTQERFLRVLNVLRDRVALQEDRVRQSQEYVRLIAPESGQQ